MIAACGSLAMSICRPRWCAPLPARRDAGLGSEPSIRQQLVCCRHSWRVSVENIPISSCMYRAARPTTSSAGLRTARSISASSVRSKTSARSGSSRSRMSAICWRWRRRARCLPVARSASRIWGEDHLVLAAEPVIYRSIFRGEVRGARSVEERRLYLRRHLLVGVLGLGRRWHRRCSGMDAGSAQPQFRAQEGAGRRLQD